MEKKTGGLLVLAGAVVFIMGIMAGHSSRVGADGASSSGSAAGGGNRNLTGSILLAGSSSMETYISALAEGYMESHPNVTVTAEFVGSGTGVEAVLSGRADIGISSRNLRDAEQESGAVENIVAMDGIVVCANVAGSVTGLTRQQLIDIYTGKVANWSQVGGRDAPIVVVGREAGSGTRCAFEERLGMEEQCVYANELDSAGAVMARVAFTPGAIGYVSLDVLDDSVTALWLDGIEPTAENIRAGDYLLSRPFVMATMGEISKQSELVCSWFDYVLGDEGQEIAASVGLVAVE